MTNASPFQKLSDTAMVLAAGFGSRMRPLTDERPKPLLEVGGRTMLDRSIDHLVAAGIKRAVINTHYLGWQIESHLALRNDIEIIFSQEAQILDTGGGIKHALRYFGGKPLLSLGADMPWFDGANPALARLAEAWDPWAMDVLLLLHPLAKAHGFGPNGDFVLEPSGHVWRKEAPLPRPYVWISAMIVKPQLYEEIPDAIFSNNRIFDIAESRGRLRGIVHDGTCYHVGTPDALARANALLESGKGWG